MSTINLGNIGGTGPDFARTHARTNDPSTSKQAARHAELFAKSHQGLIYQSLHKNGYQTAKELGLSTGLTSVQVSRRVADMERDDVVRPTGKIRDGCQEYCACIVLC